LDRDGRRHRFGRLRTSFVPPHKFVQAQGACGLLHSRSRICLGRSRNASYAVQFDDSSRYSKSAAPKIDTTVSIERF
jgi:hypothetical protein